MDVNMTYYENYYYTIINSIINSYQNSNLLIIIKNEFHILEHFSHTIKKNNIFFHVLVEDYNLNKIISKNIKGEECESNVSIYNDHKEINEEIDLIIFFHLDSLDDLNIKLLYFNNILKKSSSSLIYIYSSLYKDNNEKIAYKNYIREQIMNYSNKKMGLVLSYCKLLKDIDKSEFYKMKSIQIYKKNNYFLYGNNTVYEIILCV
jgi:hypothetical protein